MLKTLHIENMAVIKALDLEPDNGFTVLTGETGSGKSVIIDSINFLFCHILPRDLIRHGAECGYVSGYFTDLKVNTVKKLSDIGVTLSDNEVLIERTMTKDGKSSSKINGKTVTKQMIKDCGELLLAVHGQDDTKGLDSEGVRIEMIDTLASDSAELNDYSLAYSEWDTVVKRLSEIRKSEAESMRMRDMLEFQIKEIKSAKLKPGEEDGLFEQRKILQNSEKIIKQTEIALRSVYKNEKGITASFLADRAADAILKVSDSVPQYAELADRLKNIRYELDDIASEISSINDGLSGLSGDEAEKELDRIEGRLDIISKLKKKYGPSLEEVIKFGAEASEKLDEIENSGALISELEAKEKVLYKTLTEKGEILSLKRKAASKKVEKEILDTLLYLDMPKVRFEISVEPSDKPCQNGMDKVDFLMSANPGEPLLPLSKCASGGELSRVMLAVKCAIAGADEIPTLIFDEIDTGISGKTSRKVGFSLKKASSSAQVICVTHSAQIASLADTHLLISKDISGERTETKITILDTDGRINENARILGGINITDVQRTAASELINNLNE